MMHLLMVRRLVMPVFALAFVAIPALVWPAGLNWGAKTLPLSLLQKRARFPVLIPRKVPAGFSLQKAEIVWKGHVDTEVSPNYPARQGVLLLYRDSENHTIAVIEARHILSVSSEESLGEMYGEGYFDLPLVYPGMGFDYHTKGTTDYAVLYFNPAETPDQVLKNSRISAYGRVEM